jgi:hypothetical protein
MGQLHTKLSIDSKKLKRFRFKRKKKSKNKLIKSPIDLLQEQINAAQNESDLEAKQVMQNQLAFNSDLFVLNQMLMSVQFFGNYERYSYFLAVQIIFFLSQECRYM